MKSSSFWLKSQINWSTSLAKMPRFRRFSGWWRRWFSPTNVWGGKEMRVLMGYGTPPGSLTGHSPWKISVSPKGKDHLPSIIVQGRAVKLRGCTRWEPPLSSVGSEVKQRIHFSISGGNGESPLSKCSYQNILSVSRHFRFHNKL